MLLKQIVAESFLIYTQNVVFTMFSILSLASIKKIQILVYVLNRFLLLKCPFELGNNIQLVGTSSIRMSLCSMLSFIPPVSTLKHLDGNCQQYSSLLVSQGFEGNY